MATSIFSKKQKEPDYKLALQETENSILKRLNTFIDETTNKWGSTNDWIKKTGDQVNELLKRTFDLQRKVEGQIIDVENTAKKQFYDFEVKLQKKLDDIDKIYATNDKFEEIGSQIVSAVKKMDKKINAQSAKTDEVSRLIPKDTVKSKVFEKIVEELRGRDEKIAGSIPKNVASNDLVADTRREIIGMFDGYPTTEALKSVKEEVNSKIKKVADASAKTTREGKEVRKEFDRLASKVNDIKEDYVPSKMIPQIRQEMTQGDLQVTDYVKEVDNKIPTDYANLKEVNVLREFQRDILTKFDDLKTEQNQSIAVTMSNIEQIMTRTSTNVNSEIEAFKKTLAETTMGEDANFMKNIIRELADEEIKQMRSANQLFQENVKNNIIEMKNQNRNIANKVAELQASFDKLILLAQNK